MKNNLRKIKVKNEEYLYKVSDTFVLESQNNLMTIKIFLTGYKSTPLIIEMLTWDHYASGQPLKSGIYLNNKITNSSDLINLNELKYIRAFILMGQKNGWTGMNKIEIQNGLEYLNQIGYETNILKPNDLSIQYINSYWLLNLWEAIDGESIEINKNIDKYIHLNIEKGEDVEFIVNDLFKPQLLYFNANNQQKIQQSMKYVIQNFEENELCDLLNFFGGTVFPTAIEQHLKSFYIHIYTQLFNQNPLRMLENFKDVKNKDSFRFL
jgi:hypothetical protein